MKHRLMKCIHSMCRADIINGRWTHATVSVYYGFDTYNRSADYLMELISLIHEEFPDISLKEIEFYEITTSQSNRHARQTMAHIMVPSEYAKAHIDDYDLL